MNNDPYEVLGVARDADADKIRAAYRKLAKELHPDLNPGDRAAEERFKQVSVAHDILGDPDKKARFDRGEIDATGNETPRQFYRDYADGAAGASYHSAAGFEDLGDLFADLFRAEGRAGARHAHGMRRRGADIRYSLSVDFLDAVNGAKKRVTMPDGKSLDIAIPRGLRDGQVLRLKGQGRPGVGAAEAGDAFVEIAIRAHPYFSRDHADIRLDLPITLAEAVLGAKIKVPTATGSVTMSVPKGSNTGTVLRLKGKGIAKADGSPAGDQLVALKVTLPAAPDPDLEAFVRAWSAEHPYDARATMEA